MKTGPFFILLILLLSGCKRDNQGQTSIIEDIILVGPDGKSGSLTKPIDEQFPKASELTAAGARYQTVIRVTEKNRPSAEGQGLLLIRQVSGPNNQSLLAEAYPWNPALVQNNQLTLPGQPLYPAQTEGLDFLLVRSKQTDAPLPSQLQQIQDVDVFLKDYIVVQRFSIHREILNRFRCFFVFLKPCDQARCFNPHELAFDKLIFLDKTGTSFQEVTPAACNVSLDPAKAKKDTTIGGTRILTYDVRAVIRRLRSAPGYGGTYGIIGNPSNGTLYSDVMGREPSASGFTVPGAVGGTVEVNFTVSYINTGGGQNGFREFFVTNSGTIERLPTADCFQMRRIAEDWIRVRINGEAGGCKL